MKKITLLLLSAAICVWAADFWQNKPYADWSDKEVQRIQTNSPWSKQVPVAAPDGGSGGSGKRGGKGGGNASELEGAGGSGLSNGGNAGRNTGTQDVGGSSIPGGGSNGITLTVSWRTALPVREAVAKQKSTDGSVTAADAKKIIDEDQKVYAILVTGLPGRVLRSRDNLKETLLKNTELIVKGKDPIAPSEVQTGGNEQRAAILFIFPKTSPLSVDDKEVEFSTKLGVLIVKQKFHLKEMVFNGKLEL